MFLANSSRSGADSRASSNDNGGNLILDDNRKSPSRSRSSSSSSAKSHQSEDGKGDNDSKSSEDMKEKKL